MNKRSYKADFIPFVADLSSYRGGWVAWWTSCQPAWRQDKGWPLPRDNASTTNWVKVGARGQSGLFLVIMSTTWWAASIKSEKDRAEFDEAVDDVRWVIDQIIDSLKALPASAPSAPEESSRKRPSSPDIGWMARADGKRKPRPSRRLLEGGGI